MTAIIHWLAFNALMEICGASTAAIPRRKTGPFTTGRKTIPSLPTTAIKGNGQKMIAFAPATGTSLSLNSPAGISTLPISQCSLAFTRANRNKPLVDQPLSLIPSSRTCLPFVPGQKPA